MRVRVPGEEHGYKIKDAELKDKWRLYHRSHGQYRRFAKCQHGNCIDILGPMEHGKKSEA